MLYQFVQMKLSEKNHLGLIAFVIASSLSAQPTQKSLLELEYGPILKELEVLFLRLLTKPNLTQAPTYRFAAIRLLQH